MPWSSSLLLLAAIAPVVVLQQITVATAAPLVGLRGCRTSSRGNVSLPYPFSINANCSIPGFNDLTCDRTMSSPSRRLLINEGSAGGLQVTSIYLSKATIYAADWAIQSLCLISEHHGMGRSGLPFEGWDDLDSYLDKRIGSLLFLGWLAG